jgi:hypothetical protein
VLYRVWGGESGGEVIGTMRCLVACLTARLHALCRKVPRGALRKPVASYLRKHDGKCNFIGQKSHEKPKEKRLFVFVL